MNHLTLNAAQWYKVCTRVLRAWGAPDDIADCVSNSLVESELAGVYSHGVIRVADYVGYVKAGWWRPDSRPEVVRQAPAMIAVDGHYGFGQPAAHLALELTIPKAREHGIAAASVLHCGHIGRL